MTTLQNKTAFVTGASRGIGRATALALARAGHTSWFTMAARHRKRNLLSPRSKRKVDARLLPVLGEGSSIVVVASDAARWRTGASIPVDGGSSFN
jgi:NADP-dependent 3-hydroxy acid dehydrogenase YdfG